MKVYIRLLPRGAIFKSKHSDVYDYLTKTFSVRDSAKNHNKMQNYDEVIEDGVQLTE